MWIHIRFWFKTKRNRIEGHLETKQLLEFEKYLRGVLTAIHPYITRKFYLFEPEPHCLLALETKKDYLGYIEKIATKFKHPRFIKEVRVVENSSDASNGEGFLTVLNAFTDYNLFYPKKNLAHIIHCCLNLYGYSLLNEIEFCKQRIKRANKYIKRLKK